MSIPPVNGSPPSTPPEGPPADPNAYLKLTADDFSFSSSQLPQGPHITINQSFSIQTAERLLFVLLNSININDPLDQLSFFQEASNRSLILAGTLSQLSQYYTTDSSLNTSQISLANNQNQATNSATTATTSLNAAISPLLPNAVGDPNSARQQYLDAVQTLNSKITAHTATSADVTAYNQASSAYLAEINAYNSNVSSYNSAVSSYNSPTINSYNPSQDSLNQQILTQNNQELAASPLNAFTLGTLVNTANSSMSLANYNAAVATYNQTVDELNQAIASINSELIPPLQMLQHESEQQSSVTTNTSLQTPAVLSSVPSSPITAVSLPTLSSISSNLAFIPVPAVLNQQDYSGSLVNSLLVNFDPGLRERMDQYTDELVAKFLTKIVRSIVMPEANVQYDPAASASASVNTSGTGGGGIGQALLGFGGTNANNSDLIAALSQSIFEQGNQEFVNLSTPQKNLLAGNLLLLALSLATQIARAGIVKSGVALGPAVIQQPPQEPAGAIINVLGFTSSLISALQSQKGQAVIVQGIKDLAQQAQITLTDAQARDLFNNLQLILTNVGLTELGNILGIPNLFQVQASAASVVAGGPPLPVTVPSTAATPAATATAATGTAIPAAASQISTPAIVGTAPATLTTPVTVVAPVAAIPSSAIPALGTAPVAPATGAPALAIGAPVPASVSSSTARRAALSATGTATPVTAAATAPATRTTVSTAKPQTAALQNVTPPGVGASPAALVAPRRTTTVASTTATSTTSRVPRTPNAPLAATPPVKTTVTPKPQSPSVLATPKATVASAPPIAKTTQGAPIVAAPLATGLSKTAPPLTTTPTAPTSTLAAVAPPNTLTTATATSAASSQAAATTAAPIGPSFAATTIPSTGAPPSAVSTTTSTVTAATSTATTTPSTFTTAPSAVTAAPSANAATSFSSTATPSAATATTTISTVTSAEVAAATTATVPPTTVPKTTAQLETPGVEIPPAVPTEGPDVENTFNALVEIGFNALNSFNTQAIAALSPSTPAAVAAATPQAVSVAATPQAVTAAAPTAQQFNPTVEEIFQEEGINLNQQFQTPEELGHAALQLALNQSGVIQEFGGPVKANSIDELKKVLARRFVAAQVEQKLNEFTATFTSTLSALIFAPRIADYLQTLAIPPGPLRAIIQDDVLKNIFGFVAGHVPAASSLFQHLVDAHRYRIKVNAAVYEENRSKQFHENLAIVTTDLNAFIRKNILDPGHFMALWGVMYQGAQGSRSKDFKLPVSIAA